MYLLIDLATSAGGERTVFQAVRPDIKIGRCPFDQISDGGVHENKR